MNTIINLLSMRKQMVGTLPRVAGLASGVQCMTWEFRLRELPSRCPSPAHWMPWCSLHALSISAEHTRSWVSQKPPVSKPNPPFPAWPPALSRYSLTHSTTEVGEMPGGAHWALKPVHPAPEPSPQEPLLTIGTRPTDIFALFMPVGGQI